jgi:osmotically-inducible protein OsmY
MSMPALSLPLRRFEDSATARTARSRRDLGSPPGRSHCLRELQDRAVQALVDSGYAALTFIDCDVDHNRVILRGSVPSYHLKQRAQVCVQRVEGIGRVDNRLEVRRLEVRGRGPR